MTTVRIFTDHEATDAAVLLLTRKLHRMYPESHAYLLAQLPDGARHALAMAENRADYLRVVDEREGITRDYPPSLWWEDAE